MIKSHFLVPLNLIHYDEWNLYVMTYKNTATYSENNIKLYKNGEKVDHSYIEEDIEDWSETHTTDEDISGCGELDLGRYYRDDYNTRQAKMVLDELIIWEVQIHDNDVKNLYDAYGSSTEGITPPTGTLILGED